MKFLRLNLVGLDETDARAVLQARANTQSKRFEYMIVELVAYLLVVWCETKINRCPTNFARLLCLHVCVYFLF